jgi:hypothetical protein
MQDTLSLKQLILLPDDPLRTTSDTRTTDKNTALGGERFGVLGDSSKIISLYVNLFTLITIRLTVKSTVSSSAFLINVRSLRY